MPEDQYLHHNLSNLKLNLFYSKALCISVSCQTTASQHAHSHTHHEPEQANIRRVGGRGFSADVIIIDEFSFVPSDILYENALIQMIVENRTIFILSSPIDAASERMLLLGKRSAEPPYNLYFSILDLSIICTKCTDAKLTFCAHRLENRSEWKSMEGENTLRDLMPVSYFRTEVLGEQIKTTEYLFEPALLVKLFDNPALVRVTPDDIYGNTVFIGGDPASGKGCRSKMGFTAGYFCRRAEKFVVLLHPVPQYRHQHPHIPPLTHRKHHILVKVVQIVLLQSTRRLHPRPAHIQAHPEKPHPLHQRISLFDLHQHPTIHNPL